MSNPCPVCFQPWKSGQRSIQCSSCHEWVHHSNVKNCSSLTNSEFEALSSDVDKTFECDSCFSKAATQTLFPFLVNNFEDESKNPLYESNNINGPLSDGFTVNSYESKDLLRNVKT